MITKKQILIDKLKEGWVTNWVACNLVKSSQGDRMIRHIRENPPTGYSMEEQTKKARIGNNTIVYKEFRLVKHE